ncbi:MAG: hypothetical protein CHACPFDD_01113 [Phycisphaerae bacterium]|nr:hypothetical protein [Phycisphaerae bacterium]
MTVVNAVPVASALTQAFSLTWTTVDCGGGTSSVGGWALSSTIGQPDAHAPLAGRRFVLHPGFWPAVAVDRRNGFVPCDANCDGSINGFDVETFIALLTGAGKACAPCAGDLNGDGSVNGFDVDPFVAALTGGGC